MVARPAIKAVTFSLSNKAEFREISKLSFLRILKRGRYKNKTFDKNPHFNGSMNPLTGFKYPWAIIDIFDEKPCK